MHLGDYRHTEKCRKDGPLHSAGSVVTQVLFVVINDRIVARDESLSEEEKRVLTDIPTNNHVFRIAFNSRLIDCGLNARERALVLGHSVETNERFYSKRDERSLESIASRLARAREESKLSARVHSAKKEEPAELLL